MNREELNRIIDNTQKKKTYFADLLGCQLQTLQAKREGRSPFTLEDATILTKDLGLSPTEAYKIFLA